MIDSLPTHRGTVGALWLLAAITLLSGCASPELKLFATYSGDTPPADVQTSRVTLVHVAKDSTNLSLAQADTEFRGERLPWGAQVKGIMEDSLDKMQIEYVVADLSYSGTADLPNLLGYARDNDTQYLFLVQSKVSSETDFSMSFFTGTGSVNIEVENLMSIYRVNDGERVFFRDYLRKGNHGGVRKQQFIARQGAAAWVSLDTNKNINQFWEDVAFELRDSEQGGGMARQH